MFEKLRQISPDLLKGLRDKWARSIIRGPGVYNRAI